MLYLESFVHRVKLAEIVSRWMVDQPRPHDVRQLKSIVNFNSYIARIWVDRLIKRLLGRMHGSKPLSFPARNKGQLKDFVVANPSCTSRRIDEMIARYNRFPEDFYRETPFDGRVYFNMDGPSPAFVGSTRIKRFRRVAEKGSRRIVDYMFDRIRGHADDLAQARAHSLGIPKHLLITSPEEMEDEFRHAERRLIKSIKKRTIQSEMPVLAIPDVVGLKIITEESNRKSLLDALGSDPAYKLLEEEHHSGTYNAINLRVAHILPRDLLRKNPPSGDFLNILSARGFDPTTVEDQYQRFLDEAEDHVLLEIIVSNFQEFMESEIGRCMHEERVLSQRSNLDYRSPLVTSVRYLMDYMFTLCLAPEQAPLTEVPIKLWVKYMPDTMDRLVRDLFGVPSDGTFEPHGESLLAPEEVTPIMDQPPG